MKTLLTLILIYKVRIIFIYILKIDLIFS